jgi:hypothetical protein
MKMVRHDRATHLASGLLIYKFAKWSQMQSSDNTHDDEQIQASEVWYRVWWMGDNES